MSHESNNQDELDHRKLARAYVVLALARDLASNYVREKPAHAALHPLLTMLEMTHDLMEEILDQSMPPETPLKNDSDSAMCSDSVM